MPAETFEHLAGAIASGKPVNVLAVGSATTVGEAGNAGRDASFPYRMLERLQAARPKVIFDLTVRGRRGLTAADMLPLIQAAFAERQYSLVLWQTGTVEAVRGIPPDNMLGALQEGIEGIQDAGADVILIDPQFSRFLRANADLDPYEAVLQQSATMPGVVLFRRYDLMQQWVTDGEIDLERARKPDRERTMALLNTCLGEALARFVLNGLNPPAH